METGPTRGSFRGRGGPSRGRGFSDRGRGGPPRGGILRGRGLGPLRGGPPGVRGRGSIPGRGSRGGHYLSGAPPEPGLASGLPPGVSGPTRGSSRGLSGGFRGRGRGDFSRSESRGSFRGRGGDRGRSSRGMGRDRGRGRGSDRGRGGPMKRGGIPGAGGPPKRARYDVLTAQPANGYASQPIAQYGSGNGYGQPQQTAVSSYGSSVSTGYGPPQTGYQQSYQGYENYQTTSDYSQATGYPTQVAPDSRYGVSSVSTAGFNSADPYSYGKAPPQVNYQQEAVAPSVGGDGDGGSYPSANPYDDQTCNPSGMTGRGDYSAHDYDYAAADGGYGKQDYGGSAGYLYAQSQRYY